MDIPGQPRRFASTAELIAAEEPDFPSFLFSEPKLVEAIRTFQSGFDGLLTYAVKANPSAHILSIMHREGISAFDVASLTEMALIGEHAPGAALHYNNPIKSRREIKRAYEDFGVRTFTIDHVAQLDQLAAVVPPSPDVEVTVRFKAGKALKSYDFGTKFGVMEAGAVELATLVRHMGYTTSLCFHVGSQCEEAYAFERHIAAAGRIAQDAGVILKRLNVGGGFPATYISSSAPPLEVYFETIRTAVTDTFGSCKPELIAEPGRGLVTPSTSLLLRVKHQRGEQSVYLNDGVYGSLMEAMILEFMPPIRVWRGDRILTGESWNFTVFGPTCDSYDMMPQTFILPEAITEDDYIEFGLMGAYTQASLTPFNGFDRRDLYWVDDILV
ncbi:type III PLP-dependent enzyme [Pelagibacterium montanilacus]|uniref:type III PLP-dependent enzyme n=1 Tax=Pelagibacterium montanilacus TaxID=2185280 RepID=UPI000F8D9FE9|nr:type III PLP-dependent enzyme [Pelagibacterium montanilacus]